MKVFLVLALLGLAASFYGAEDGGYRYPDEYAEEGRYPEDEPYDRYNDDTEEYAEEGRYEVAEEEYYDRYNDTERHRYYTKHPYYTERKRTGPTTEPRIIRDFFDISAWEVNDIIDRHEEPTGGRDHYWDADVSDPVTRHIIPELCHVTPENCTVYNTFLLDCNCVKELESVSPECRSFKCDATHYFLEHGADIYAKFIRAGSIKEAVQVVNEELTDIFDDLNVCTCGKEFLKVLLRKCAPFYNGNALAYALYDGDDIVAVQRYLRNIDFNSLSKVFERLIDGMCEETNSGRCLNSIFTVFEDVAELVNNTIRDYEDYDDGDRVYQKSQEKRCDALFGPIKVWDRSHHDIDDLDEEEEFEALFTKTAEFMNSFYCAKSCKRERGSFYPCCMRRLLEDKNLFKAIENVIVSVYRTIPTNDLDYDGFAEIDRYFYMDHNLEELFAWTIPKPILNAFKQTINAPKYCKGKMVRCSEGPEA